MTPAPWPGNCRAFFVAAAPNNLQFFLTEHLRNDRLSFGLVRPIVFVRRQSRRRRIREEKMAYQTFNQGSVHKEHRFGLNAFGSAGQRGLDAVLTWLERYHTRSELQRLDDHMLKDIGLSAADVEREAGKRFWQA